MFSVSVPPLPLAPLPAEPPLPLEPPEALLPPDVCPAPPLAAPALDISCFEPSESPEHDERTLAANATSKPVTPWAQVNQTRMPASCPTCPRASCASCQSAVKFLDSSRHWRPKNVSIDALALRARCTRSK